ncbi:MAG: hypothetical protein KJ063_11275 [Anaerolineae bacterium]|nr:hypothetical protein [Anaerolineae bacterium]
MKMHNLGISLFVGIVLGILLIQSGLPTVLWATNDDNEHRETVPVTVTDSDSFSWLVKELMLNSHSRWRTIQAEAITTWYPPGQDQFQVFTNIYIEGNSRVRIEDIESNQERPHLWVMNESGIYANNYHPSPELARLPIVISDHYQQLPRDVASINTQVIYRHPIAGALTTPVSDYLYPVGFAQRANGFALKGEDEIAGRSTWIVEWIESEPASLKQLFWVDQEMGIILKALWYIGEDLDKLYSETIFTQIVFNDPIPVSVFEVILDDE